MPSASVNTTEGADFYFTVSEEMISMKKQLFFYGYSNDDDIYENSKANMKIYYNDDIATEMQRMFNNGFGIIINANDVTMTQIKINYIKGRQTVYYIGVKLIDDPIEFNLYDELYGATNENTKSICYYTSTDLSYKNIILDIL